MDIAHHYFPVTKSARYATYGTLSDKTKYFWFALHGSKMLCEQMLYKFKDFNPEEHFVVAPEGLSRFYLDGFGGDVVATWMTSRDRLQEIEDFSLYLSSLLSAYQTQLPIDCKTILLGFSQGGTTLFRWLHQEKVSYHSLIAYSCWIPEDIDLKESKSSLKNRKILYTYGEQDSFLSKNRIQALNEIIKENNLDVKMLPYEGTHRVDRAQLSFLWSQEIK